MPGNIEDKKIAMIRNIVRSSHCFPTPTLKRYKTLLIKQEEFIKYKNYYVTLRNDLQKDDGNRSSRHGWLRQDGHQSYARVLAAFDQAIMKLQQEDPSLAQYKLIMKNSYCFPFFGDRYDLVSKETIGFSEVAKKVVSYGSC